VSTASVERAFSAMNIIKSNLRNKINDDWLNDLMICYTEREIFKSLDDVDIIRTFTTSKTLNGNLPLAVKIVPMLSNIPGSAYGSTWCTTRVLNLNPSSMMLLI
jgi:hypothetical protein